MTMIASLGLVSGGLGLNLAAVFRRQYSLNQQIYSAAFSQCKYCMLRRLSMGSFSNYRIYNRRHLTRYENIIEDVIVPTPLVGGGTIYSNGFFVQSVLADRYIHRREM